MLVLLYSLLLLLCGIVIISHLDYVVKGFIDISYLISKSFSWCIRMDYDTVTVLILMMLFMCFSYVLLYTHHYFSGAFEGYQLKSLIMLFVCVMGCLVMTGDLMSTLIFWEYLGVTSFFLILFYCSYLSLRSSVVTLVSSRFGDVALFMLISVFSYSQKVYMLPLMFMILVIMTKSASFPFISWLLEAMRAPTPVSSLVHSSTLVAAGVWFSMRYDIKLIGSFVNSTILTIMLLVTMLMTGVCCFYYIDLKKIVALSTCKKIAWCVFYLSFGDVALSLFQLISHGVSKCMLFMLVGDVMSGSSGSQNSNCMYTPCLYKNWSIFSLMSVVIGLAGMPYIGVFFTKHFLLTSFNKMWSVSMVSMMMGCVFLSYFYSFRLCSVILKVKVSISLGMEYFFNTSLMIYFWLFMNLLLSYTLDEVNTLSCYFSLELMMFQLMACYTAVMFYSSTFVASWSSSLFGCDKIVELTYSFFIWFNNLMYSLILRWDTLTMSSFYNLGTHKMKLLSVMLIKMLFISGVWLLASYMML